ncbi:MAG: hypothetical protein HC849_13605 [Oscillatoriales cyanobacterium RU_3_3]|nr:hypothetical protein [Microcoleus sp. SU_5_6]NJM61009.1 hypothetical protein [Oscillatoriales cyanobacterium RU_3_3]
MVISLKSLVSSSGITQLCLSTIYQLSNINSCCQLSTVNCQLSTVNCQLSTVNYQLSTINCQLSTVNYF